MKFSLDRQLKINDPSGPAYLLGNLDSISTPDDLTTVFQLKAANDQTFAQVLSTSAGAIVDEQVFSADKVTPDKDIVKGDAFTGQYKIDSYDFNNLITFTANPNYAGLLGKAEDRFDHAEVLHERVEHEARHPAGQHRRRIPEPLGHRPGVAGQRQEGQGRQRSRW